MNTPLLVQRISTVNAHNRAIHNSVFLHGTNQVVICLEKFDVLFPKTSYLEIIEDNCFICLSKERPNGISGTNLAKIQIVRNMCPFTIMYEDEDKNLRLLSNILYRPLEDKLLTFFNENLPWKNTFEGYVYLTKTHPITKKRIRK